MTASSLARIEACPSSYNLPQFGHVSEASSAGTAVHAFLEAATTVGAAKALESVPAEHHEACAILALEDLPAFKPGAFAAEVAFAFDINTHACRELGRGIGRDYIKAGAHPTNDVCGSADVVGLTDDAVVVIDWKTGWTHHEPTSLQLKFLGMVAAQTYGKEKAHVLIYRIRDGEVSHLSGVLDALDFAAIAKNVVEIERRAAESGTRNLVTSDLCRFCPSLSACPAQAGLVNALSLEGGSALTAADLAATLTVDKVRKAWALKKAATFALERIDEACRLFCATNPTELDNGKVLGPVTVEKESLDAGCIHKVLTKRYGVEVADGVVQMSATKKDLDATLKAQAVAKGTPFAGLKREVYDELRRLGGSRTSTSTSVREHARGKE